MKKGAGSFSGRRRFSFLSGLQHGCTFPDPSGKMIGGQHVLSGADRTFFFVKTGRTTRACSLVA